MADNNPADASLDASLLEAPGPRCAAGADEPDATDVPATLDAMTLSDQIAAAFTSFRAENERRLSRLEDLVSKLALAAAADDLTGTLRRGPGLMAIERELERARRSGERLVVAMVDLDGLKHVNDSEGHLAGDAFLASAVEVITHGLRASDLVLRYGGDEFVCCLPGMSTEEAEARFAQMLSQLGALHPSRSFSVGYVLCGPDEHSVRDLIARADHDLYTRRRARRQASVVDGGPTQ